MIFPVIQTINEFNSRQANISAPIPKKIKEEEESQEIKPSRMQVEAAYLDSIKSQPIPEVIPEVVIENKKEDVMDIDEPFDGKRVGFPPVTKLPAERVVKMDETPELERNDESKPEIKTVCSLNL